MSPLLFEMAMLDYNMVQAIYQTNVKAMSKWWRKLGLGNNLSFARDRLTESFLWSIGIFSEPESGYSREVNTKVIQLVTSIDDIYDLYGTLGELELFTDVVDRWDVNAMEQLPDYMKICLLSVKECVDIRFKQSSISLVPHRLGEKLEVIEEAIKKSPLLLLSTQYLM
ncbi:alpha-terpineol synthase, chloroplastic-like [Tasmannia lanceolata]|uniref:alpha-terpineol synthase, chloroplastic-like n=1 Tax=Tasmannia lanceolata TaxID=3420 RepID=UPI004063BA77